MKIRLRRRHRQMLGGAERPPGPDVRRSRILAVVSILSGLLTAVVGFVVLGTGIGFSNATASGTGAAGTFVGLWMALAARGVARRRLRTFVGLGLAWSWLVGRVIVDFPATLMSAVVVVFMIPGISVPVALVWITVTVLGGLGGLWRALGEYRRGRGRSRSPGGRANAPPRQGWRLVGVCARLAVLVVLTLAVPPLVWSSRGETIAELRAAYRAPAGEAAPRARFGACSLVFLGYELTQQATRALDEKERHLLQERSMAGALADLESIVRARARSVRVGASGDHLLVPRSDQERLDDEYMDAVRRTGLPLVLVDCQHPQALGRRLGWEEFCRFQRQRIEYYLRRYDPDVYIVVCEPLSYHQFILTPETSFSADAWAAQLSDMCRLVKAIRSATRTGITLLVLEDKRPEWEVWTRMRTLPELDILSVEIYEPRNFRQTEERLEEYGHPRRTGKAFWIAETYNGWALSSERRWDQDAAWLEVADGFARVVNAEVVLVWTFGSFVRGGSFYQWVTGRLGALWESTRELSPVGQAFARIQEAAPR